MAAFSHMQTIGCGLGLSIARSKEQKHIEVALEEKNSVNISSAELSQRFRPRQFRGTLRNSLDFIKISNTQNL